MAQSRDLGSPRAGIGGAVTPDDWPARIAKLLPGEALVLCGTAQAFLPPDSSANRQLGQWLVVVVALLVTIVLRRRATMDGNGRPQWLAVVIACASFVLWVAATGPPISPISLGSFDELTALVAFLWSTAIAYFYPSLVRE